MGTRHLTIVKHGEKLFGNYGQWDGYPNGQGAVVWDFIKNHFDKATFTAHFDNSHFVTQEELENLWAEFGVPKGAQLIDWDVAKSFGEKYPNMSRDFGAKILGYIQSTSTPLLRNQIEFAAESLWCEWAWMLDLDTDELKVFFGFSHEPLADNEPFKYLESTREKDDKYYPIRLIATIPFSEVKEIKDKKEFVFIIESHLPKEYRDDEDEEAGEED